ncbi:MAG: hypothetical protein Q9191_000022 [Dirinaria sp. TL-2023a]
MRFSTLTTSILAALPLASQASPFNTPWAPHIQDYFTLGCPENTTKPFASQHEQTKVLLAFATDVYVKHLLNQGYDTYAAKDFINHAPEISGNGTAIAIKTQGPMLAGGSVQLQRVFAGADENGVSYGTIHFKGISPVRGVGAIAGIWRLVGTCLVEYWDVAEGVALNETSNPIAYFRK